MATQKQPVPETAAKWYPLSELTPDSENANTHDARSIETIARSLLRFGMRKNIVADKHKVIRAGNGTYEAIQWIAGIRGDDVLQALAVKHGLLRKVVSGKKVTFEPYILCEVTNLDGDEATAYALADNQTATLSQRDMSKVAAQLSDLQARTTINDLGWTAAALKAIIKTEDNLNASDDENNVNQLDGVVYKIIIVCADEADQLRIMEHLAEQEIECQPLNL